MPFVKGQSGNPGGRKPIPEEVKELARAATPKAMRRQVELIDSEDEAIALKATELVLNRAFGKPAQTVNVNSEKRDALDYSIGDLLEIAYGRGVTDESRMIEGKAVASEACKQDGGASES